MTTICNKPHHCIHCIGEENKMKLELTEIRNEKGELHCDNGPAVYDEKKEYMLYYKNGKLHRLDGPALIQPKYIDGIHHKEEWYKDGLLHRDGDAPALYYTFTSATSEIEGYEKTYYKYGKQHRIGAPARFLYDPFTPDDKSIMCEWYIDDEMSRDPNDGPAQYILEEDGTTFAESYYYHGYKLDKINIPICGAPGVSRTFHLGVVKNIPIYTWIRLKQAYNVVSDVAHYVLYEM